MICHKLKTIVLNFPFHYTLKLSELKKKPNKISKTGGRDVTLVLQNSYFYTFEALHLSHKNILRHNYTLFIFQMQFRINNKILLFFPKRFNLEIPLFSVNKCVSCSQTC